MIADVQILYNVQSTRQVSSNPSSPPTLGVECIFDRHLSRTLLVKWQSTPIERSACGSRTILNEAYENYTISQAYNFYKYFTYSHDCMLEALYPLKQNIITPLRAFSNQKPSNIIQDALRYSFSIIAFVTEVTAVTVSNSKFRTAMCSEMCRLTTLKTATLPKLSFNSWLKITLRSKMLLKL